MDKVFVQQVNLDYERKAPNRLIYLGTQSRPYGINESDTWGMDTYMAAVMANGLRMLVAYGHLYRDGAEYERIASKLEFYATDISDVLSDNIDWSNDPERDFGEEGWLDTSDQPGFREYCEKSIQIEYWQSVYMTEALEWLKDNWGQLWD